MLSTFTCLLHLFIIAEIWYVDTTGFEGLKLQIAVNNAHSSPGIDTVIAKNGTYHLFLNDSLGLIMKDSVVLMSENGPALCTLTTYSSNQTNRGKHVIYCDDAGFADSASHAAKIRGFTIKDAIRAGMKISDASPTIEDCIIRDNEWSGIRLLHSNSIIENSEIINNVSCYFDTFNWEHYGDGGGISIVNSNPVVESCLIAYNWAGATGGGISIFGGIDEENPIIRNNNIKHNEARGDDGMGYPKGIGGGIYCTGYTNFSISNNQIDSNYANYEAGAIGMRFVGFAHIDSNEIRWNTSGIFVEYSESLIISNNKILYNGLNQDFPRGVTLYAFYSNAYIYGNQIEHNVSESWWPILAGGITLNGCYSSSYIDSNIIRVNQGIEGGGISVNSSIDRINGNIIERNRAHKGGGIYVADGIQVLHRNLISGNSANYGGGIYVDNGGVVIDSSLIVDNGSKDSTALYFSSNSSNSSIQYSNIYFNTFQPGIDIINNNPTDTLNVKNNFWWSMDSIEIDSLISGIAQFMPFYDDFVPNVPAEPANVDSIRNYTSNDYSTVDDFIGIEDTLFLRLYGTDRNAHSIDASLLILKSSIYTSGIGVALVETDTNSGIFEGEAYPVERTNLDKILEDDIYQKVGVDSSGDVITVISKYDTTKFFEIGFSHSNIRERISRGFYFSIIPSIRNIEIIYRITMPSHISMDIFDVLGRKIYNKNWYSTKGNHTLLINSRTFNTGIYFIHFNAGDFSTKRKIILLK